LFYNVKTASFFDRLARPTKSVNFQRLQSFWKLSNKFPHAATSLAVSFSSPENFLIILIVKLCLLPTWLSGLCKVTSTYIYLDVWKNQLIKVSGSTNIFPSSQSCHSLQDGNHKREKGRFVNLKKLQLVRVFDLSILPISGWKNK